MKNLELKHLGAYFPYHLKCIAVGIKTPIEICGINNYSHKIQNSLGVDTFYFQEIKLILRPLSDLDDNDCWSCFDYSKEDVLVLLDDKRLQYYHMIYLIENHFDVFGLIEQGLAVDINTL